LEAQGYWNLFFWQRKYLPTTSISFEQGRYVFCTTQTTPSVAQGGYGGVSSGYQVSDNGYKLPDTRSRETGRFTTYQSTVYEPFTAAAPSDNHPMAAGAGEPQITGRKNLGGMGGHDPGGPASPNSPVGEPFVLLLFAAVAALVVARRQRQTA